ncbi:MAG: aminotransferase class IV [Pseudomonadota bacterium]
MSTTPLPFAWHDGGLKPLSDVHISPLDRGFLFGDGVYEVIPYPDGRAVGLRGHLQRLRDSLEAIDLPLAQDDDALEDIFEQVVSANGGVGQSLYLQVSRAGDTRRNHAFPDHQISSLFVMTQPLASLDIDRYHAGFHAILAEDTRWQRCDIKSTSLLANVLARQAAADADAIEAILHRDGFITEGSTSAIACVVDGALIAPPLDTTLLPSVTRDLVWRLAERMSLPTRCEAVPVNTLLAASEVWLMSSTKDVAPIVSVGANRIGDGKPGPLWRTLFDAFQDTKYTL